jgi:hypothetical protein
MFCLRFQVLFFDLHTSWVVELELLPMMMIITAALMMTMEGEGVKLEY